MAENQALLDELNNIILPQLQIDLEFNQTLLDELNEVTLVQLQADLDENAAALDTLNTVALPELDDRLATANGKIEGLEGAGFVNAEEVNALVGNFGYITANEVYADFLTANQIYSDFLTANQIYTDYLTANQIAADYVTSNYLSTNYLTANQINADFITANEVAADYVTTNQLYADFLTANQINADYMTANQVNTAILNAGYVTAEDINSLTITGATIQTSGSTSQQRLRLNTSGLFGYPAYSSTPALQIGGDGTISLETLYAGESVNITKSTGNVLVVSGDALFNKWVTASKVFATSPSTDASAVPNIRRSDNEYKVTSHSNSSRRYKKNIETLDLPESTLFGLRPVSYNLKKKPSDRPKDHLFYGFIAEELDELGLKQFLEYDKKGRPDEVDYIKMVVLMAAAVNNLNARLKEIEQDV